MSDNYLEINKEYAKVFEDNVKLLSSPVAVKLVKSQDEIPEGIELVDEKVRHCEMVRKASLGNKFYSTIDEQTCLGGAGAIGLRDMPPKLASGEKYYSLGRFKDIETAQSAVKELSVIPNEYWGIIYSPLEDANFEADVILIISEPVTGMKIAQSIVYSSGAKVNCSFAGIQSVCGDAVAYPFLNDGINFTLGCDGSRKAADIKDNEMTIGISSAQIDEVIENLKAI